MPRAAARSTPRQVAHSFSASKIAAGCIHSFDQAARGRLPAGAKLWAHAPRKHTIPHPGGERTPPPLRRSDSAPDPRTEDHPGMRFRGQEAHPNVLFPKILSPDDKATQFFI